MVISVFDDNAGGAKIRFWGIKHLKKVTPKSRNLEKYVFAGTYLAQSRPMNDPQFNMVEVRPDKIPQGVVAYSAGQSYRYADRTFMPISFLRER
tara:strand:- start:333 stop:614 length:282 start_codon:yes stop_codon:yes gene_type:complete